jgi:DNA-binding transcriptional LysR family regulator
MTLHQLKIFAMVGRLKNFTQTADNLHVRQPSVSLLVKGLERELEAKLFEKLGNKVHLTLAGEKLLQRTEEILAKVDGIKEEIDEIKGLKKGKIRVGGSALAAASFLLGAVQSFRRRYPGVEVILKIQRSDSLEKRLLERELDVAIVGWPLRSPLLVGEPYRQEEIVVIAPPKHPLTKKRSVPLELIAKEPLISSEKGTFIRNMIEKRFAEEGLPFSPILEVDEQFGARDAVRRAVANGLCLGFLTKSHVVQDVAGGRLKVVKVPELNLKRTMYIAVHKKRLNSSLVQAFIDLLKQYKEKRW